MEEICKKCKGVENSLVFEETHVSFTLRVTSDKYMEKYTK